MVRAVKMVANDTISTRIRLCSDAINAHVVIVVNSSASGVVNDPIYPHFANQRVHRKE